MRNRGMLQGYVGVLLETSKSKTRLEAGVWGLNHLSGDRQLYGGPRATNEWAPVHGKSLSPFWLVGIYG